MSIRHQILGRPGRDNALSVTVDTGQAVHEVLFDCGQDCLRGLSIARIQDVEHLFFSHFHMDHVAGFDGFFRVNYNRPSPPVHVWGPAETIALMHHRFRSYLWNLHATQSGTWHVHEMREDRILESRFRIREAFDEAHSSPPVEWRAPGLVWRENGAFDVSAILLDHHTPSVGYLLREPDRLNVNPARLQESGLPPGPWINRLKDLRRPDEEEISVGQRSFRFADLRRDLLVRHGGDSIAYLTDFHLDARMRSVVCRWLSGVGTLVCEAQYHGEDAALANRNAHMTTRLVAALARDCGAGRLILMHLSRRYTSPRWLEMLEEARRIFPATAFPEHWRFASGER